MPKNRDSEARAARREANRQRNEPPRRSLLEEIGNAVTHGVGALLSLAGLVFLLLKSDTAAKIAAALVYGLCLFVLFSMSCLYHAFRSGSKVKRLWRRFDYISIYLLIGGTFAPLLLVYWGNALGLWLFIAQWAIIVTGVTFVGVFGPGRLKGMHTALFIALGWSGLIFLPDMVRDDLPLFWTILGGGVLYTVGILPFMLRRRGAHFLWHIFVLLGALAHWLGIYLFVY
ncbi:MAG: hemolysin III family protein [Clostridia bacterium]|nr:hemolysin III family protein [Clostridia bacterium]